MDRDLLIVLKELQDIGSFKITITTNLIQTLDEKALKEWMIMNMSKLL